MVKFSLRKKLFSF